MYHIAIAPTKALRNAPNFPAFPCSEGKSCIFFAAKGFARTAMSLIRLANPPLANVAAHISEEFPEGNSRRMLREFASAQQGADHRVSW
jgi:hypothetical protein